MKTTLLSMSVLCLAGFYSLTAKANTFDVYCVPSLDGVSTCSGWEQDQKLQCVSSPGGVASCRSSGGARFDCTQDVSGLTTCQNNKTIPGQSHPKCTAIGNGSFSCQDDEFSQTTNKDTTEALKAVSDIIGDSTSSPIDKDLSDSANFINQRVIINTPSLKP